MFRDLILGDEPTPPPVNERSALAASDADWETAQRKLKVIRAFFEAEDTASVADIAKKNEIGTSTLYRWVGTYLSSDGDGLSLLRKPRRPGRRLHPAVLEVCVRLIFVRYLALERIPVSLLILEIQDECISKKLPAPCRTAVDKLIHRIPPEYLTKKRMGPRAARNGFKPVGAGYTEADQPYRIVEIDSTPGDVKLVDPVYREEIGRASITAGVDVFSRMGAGFFVSLENPGYLTTGLCLTHIILPKGPWLLERGLDYDWPCEGEMDWVHVDSGGEFVNKNLQRVCERRGITLQHRRLKTEGDGGHIESFLKTINLKLQTLAGSTFSNPQAKGDYPSDKYAHMTVRELETFLGHFIAGEYANKPHSGLNGQTPLAKFREGLVTSSKGLPVGNLRKVGARDSFCIELLPMIEKSVTRNGIKWVGLKWNCEELRVWIDSREPSNIHKPRKFRVHYDPRDIRFLYFYDERRDTYVQVPLVDRSIGPMSLLEWKAIRKRQSIKYRAEEDRATAARARDGMRAISNEAKNLTMKTRRSIARKRDNATNNIHTQLTPQQKVSDASSGRVARAESAGEARTPKAEIPTAWMASQPFTDLE